MILKTVSNTDESAETGSAPIPELNTATVLLMIWNAQAASNPLVFHVTSENDSAVMIIPSRPIQLYG